MNGGSTVCMTHREGDRGESGGNKQCKGLKVVPWISGLCPVSAGEPLKALSGE